MHAILEAAIKVVPAPHRPVAPVHLGGATPRLTAGRYAELASFCGTEALSALSPAEHRLVTQVLELLHPSFDDRRFMTRYRQLKGETGRETPVATQLLVAVKDCRWASLSMGRPGLARACVTALRRVHGPQEAARFVAALDETLCRLDALSTFERLGVGRGDITRVLARGERDDETTALVVQLPDARFGLLWRPDGQWRWVDGSRDEVLPLVPSDLFAFAVARALG